MNSQDMSILSLITGASLPVQFVMAGLLAISIASWTTIFSKIFAIRAAQQATASFEAEFWSGGDLAELAKKIQQQTDAGPLAKIFAAGLQEFAKVRQQKAGDVGAMIDGARRAMRATFQREFDGLESNLAMLASAGSVSPYIGLFGTVWGIMNSFRGLANVQQATLQSVAPGIAEALVATAIGLFAAIPAVVAYNRFANEIDRLSNRCETFMEEFLNILQRQAR